MVSGGTYYYHFAYFWGGLYLFAWLHSLIALYGIEVHRVAHSHRSQVGQIFEERFEVHNRSRFLHLWVSIEDHSLLPGANASRVVTLLRGREIRSFLVRTRLVKRGIFPLGETHLTSGDLFGLFPVKKVIPAKDSLLVYPMTVDIQGFPQPSGWITGGEAIRRRTQQITPNAVGVRDYTPGDPLNRIHWLSTARRDRLIVKEFELDPLAEIWLFFDAFSEFHTGSSELNIELSLRDQWKPIVSVPLPPSSFEYQVTVCASLARYYLKIGRAVGFVAKDRSLHILPAERGSRQFGKIMERLALLEPEGRLPIYTLVENQAKQMPRGSTAILISPTPGEDLPRSVAYLDRGGYRPIVIFVDPSSFGGDKGGTEILYSSLDALSAKYFIIRQGDDLVSVLSSGLERENLQSALLR